jgi:hypothetical protein
MFLKYYWYTIRHTEKKRTLAISVPISAYFFSWRSIKLILQYTGICILNLPDLGFVGTVGSEIREPKQKIFTIQELHFELQYGR